MREINMGQQEVMDFLSKYPTTWFTIKEISEHLDVNDGSIRQSAKKLGGFLDRKFNGHAQMIKIKGE